MGGEILFHACFVVNFCKNKLYKNSHQHIAVKHIRIDFFSLLVHTSE